MFAGTAENKEEVVIVIEVPTRFTAFTSWLHRVPSLC